ncbi:hypothetical protein GCK32_018133 [Trichostrongylus colubriformis]|uniref:Uncharacterized protein n=1 Tax=Trichostrongylus colubriformis TaxID=6319 RepID=A0AAN8G1X4_TRICO
MDSKKLSPSIFAQLIPKAMNEIRLITDEDSEGSDDENLPSYKATKKHASDRKQKKSPAESPAPQSKSRKRLLVKMWIREFLNVLMNDNK